MAVTLLERDHELATLHALLDEIVSGPSGQGRIALVSGEAGIGKTALVERFVADVPPDVRTFWGACEALFTPRPLGPLYDIVQQAQTPLRVALESNASRATLFAAVLDELTHDTTPTIVVVEDVHWADEATLDLIKYVARRIHRIAALLILTYRDDEIGKDHPLRHVLGDLPARDVIRLRLLPLSEEAVTTLARRAKRSGNELYLATSGNPFFLSEALSSGAPGVPASVSDTVLARAARLSPGARAILDVVAIAPSRLERWALKALTTSAPGLDECLEAGMLRIDETAVAFRHELARQAIEGALSPRRARSLHRQALDAFMDQRENVVPIARLVHHALHVGDAALTLRFAPLAAQEAAAQGAHREAAAHYANALRFADALPLEQRAELYERLAYERYLTSQIEGAVEARMAALDICRGPA